MAEGKQFRFDLALTPPPASRGIAASRF